MPDVFISYARVDEAQAQCLAEALREAGIDVWWDADLIGGEEFRSKIRELIGSARRVIVLWSKTSVDSGFVIDEANEARRQHKLVPVSIDGTPPPFGFGNLHTLRFENAQTDLGKIVAAVRRTSASLTRPPITTRTKRRSIFIAAGALLIVALAGIGYWLASNDASRITGSSTKQRLALLIGNAIYSEANAVPNAERDVDRLSDELQKRGFKVIKMINVDRDQMVRAITDFEGTLATLGGVGLFYYAGDGGYVESSDLMLPVDIGKSAIRKKGVNISRLLRDLKDSPSSSIVNNGTVVIYSTAKRQRAAPGPANGHSPFNDAFVSALAAADDDLSDFFRRLSATFAQNEARASAGSRQTPYMEAASNAEFFFNKRDRDSAIGLLRIVVLDSNRDELNEKETFINAK